MAAIRAAEAGARAIVVEKNAAAGVKLLSTGGGRCNVTNTAALDDFARAFGPRGRFVTDALRRFDATALRLLLASLDVPTQSLDGRHVYPKSERARDVRDALLRRCRELGVEVECNVRVASLTASDGAVSGLATDGFDLDASRVVVAAGGRSYPAFGSSGDGYELARSAGHAITDPVPALVPLVIEGDLAAECAGVSVPCVKVRVAPGRGKDPCERGGLLFTHKGVSGPAVLNVSGAASMMLADGVETVLLVDFTPAVTAQDWERRLDVWRSDEGAAKVRTLVARHLPARLAAALVARACRDGDVRASQLSGEQRAALVSRVKKMRLDVVDTEGWDRAMVTRGGVTLKEVDPRTLESRLCRGLYFAGEVLDLDGPCGGYNLQWAFSSGALAGASAARS
jgi:predicted Rossmann fold flavoprotein